MKNTHGILKHNANNCRYMLVTVIEREILTEIFDTYDDAYKTMLNELQQYGGIQGEHLNADEAEAPDSWGYCKWNAYLNDGSNHDNYDWLIVQI